MTPPLSPDAEKYREQLEARARIHHATSELVLEVSRPAEGQPFAAELVFNEADPPPAGAPERASLRSVGETAERALEELAEQLDAVERTRAAQLR
jgi:hypothetical protein